MWGPQSPLRGSSDRKIRVRVFLNVLYAYGYSLLVTAFVDMLNSMRFGQMDSKTIEAFTKLSRKVKYDDLIEPTEL